MKLKILFVLIILATISSCEKTENTAAELSFYQNGEVQKIFENDPEGINVIFLGDGFVKKDLMKGGIYESSGKSIIDYLFTVPPFSTYKEYFNAYIVYAESKNEFISQKNLPKQTVFSIALNDTNDRLFLNNPGACINYAQNAVNYDPEKAHIIIVLANDYRSNGVASQVMALQLLAEN